MWDEIYCKDLHNESITQYTAQFSVGSGTQHPKIRLLAVGEKGPDSLNWKRQEASASAFPCPNILIEQVASQECSPSVIPSKAQYCAIYSNWSRSESRQQFSGLSCIQLDRPGLYLPKREVEPYWIRAGRKKVFQIRFFPPSAPTEHCLNAAPSYQNR